jgi:plasmid replication initiation protein
MNNNNQLVTKSNSLNEARYKLTLQEQRIILSVISMIQPSDEDFKIYRIKVNEFVNFLEINNRDAYSEIKRITKELMKKILILPKRESELHISWFSSVEYFDKRGYVELQFDPKLKPYLLNLKECFTTYRLKNVIHLRSLYSIRLYELLKQYEMIGTRRFEMDNLREIMGITSSEYKLYGDFKRHIILASQKELQKKTDLRFKFKESKTGRKVTAIEFYIESTKQEGVEESKQNRPITHSEDQGVKVLFDFVLLEFRDRKTVKDLITRAYKQHGHEYVASNIQYTNQNYKRNYRSFLGKSLKENWGRIIQEEEEAKHKIQEAEQDKIKRQKERYLKDKQEADRLTRLNREAREYIEGLSPKELAAIRQEAIEKIRTESEKQGKQVVISDMVVNLMLNSIALGKIGERQK